MTALQKQEEAFTGLSGKQASGISVLLRTLNRDGTPFHTRLAKALAFYESDIPAEVLHMARSLLRAHGKHKDGIGLGEFNTYRQRLDRFISTNTRTSKLTDMGKDTCERLFIGCMLMMIDPDTKEYAALKAAWNGHAQRNQMLR